MTGDPDLSTYAALELGRITFPSSQGWECPRCHTINAPHVSRCECRPGANSNKTTLATFATHYGERPPCERCGKLDELTNHRCFEGDNL